MRIWTAAAAATALMANAAYADPGGAATFRSPAPQELTTEEIAKLNLDAEAAAKLEQHLLNGDQIVALSADQLDELTAGSGGKTWVIIGVVALVVIVAVAAGGDGGGGGGY